MSEEERARDSRKTLILRQRICIRQSGRMLAKLTWFIFSFSFPFLLFLGWFVSRVLYLPTIYYHGSEDLDASPVPRLPPLRLDEDFQSAKINRKSFCRENEEERIERNSHTHTAHTQKNWRSDTDERLLTLIARRVAAAAAAAEDTSEETDRQSKARGPSDA